MKRTILILFVTSLLVGSCSFFNDDYHETVDQFVSVAYRSDNADFSQYETYVVADSILYVDGDKNVRKKNDLTDEVKSVIAGAMNALGYTPFIASSASSKPDLILDLGYIVSTTTTIYPGYWWGWDYWYCYDWFYPYYPYDPYYPGGFYPYYPYPMYPMASSYSSGSLTIDIVDLMIETYPQHMLAPMALYIKAFVYESVDDIPSAKETYRLFLEKYPNDPLVEDVKASLRNAGIPLEELVRQFEEE